MNKIVDLEKYRKMIIEKENEKRTITLKITQEFAESTSELNDYTKTLPISLEDRTILVRLVNEMNDKIMTQCVTAGMSFVFRLFSEANIDFPEIDTNKLIVNFETVSED